MHPAYWILLKYCQTWRAASFVKGDYDRTSSVTPMLNDLGWETLHQRRQQAKVVMLYRIVHGLVAVPPTPFLIQAAVTERRGQEILVPRLTVNTHKYSFIPSTIRIWNRLLHQVVSVPSIEAFKLLLQTSTM